MSFFKESLIFESDENFGIKKSEKNRERKIRKKIVDRKALSRYNKKA